MEIASILEPGQTVSSLAAGSKKRAIELASLHITDKNPNLDVGEVYRGLLERERLGSTAIGHGVAIPHCRLDHCDKIIGGLFILEEPVDFSAPDEGLVSIMFVLLVPEGETTEHLKALAMLAEKFERQSFRDALINAPDSEALYNAATSDPTPPDAVSTQP